MAEIMNISVSDVAKILQVWDKLEFVDFVTEKCVDGRKLLGITEGAVKIWRPKSNAKDLIIFIENMKSNPDKYLKCLKGDEIVIKETNLNNNPYQTVSVRKISQADNVEEILKRIVIPKSFLYRNKKDKANSYVPMDAGSGKKPKRFFRLSSYEYPILKSKFSKTDNPSDRGYYSIKTNDRMYIQKPRKEESRPKYRSLSTSQELNENIIEDHLYEDLYYNDVNETKNEMQRDQIKPCLVKIQELLQSFKFSFFKKSDEVPEKVEEKVTNSNVVNEREVNFYENNDLVEMYDSVHVQKDVSSEMKIKESLAVEDYLEPVSVNKDYCDVCLKQKEDSLLGFIMNYFETRFGRRETSDAAQSEESEVEPSCDESKWRRVGNMAARPLPVPVENEPYYMNIDRHEAEELLLGQADGTFILRPSSQVNHAYTLSVSCANVVHNVGVRRCADGRLALGFARRGERSFTSVTSLLRHHKRRRLLLVAGGELIGATTLNESLQYYQVPKNIPLIKS